jgi:GNAT superfamily N-acetyltransferase
MELLQLYRLHRFHETARYILYKNTYFLNAGSKTDRAFSRLLDAMHQNPNMPAIQFSELSDLQETLRHSQDRKIFSRMVFPSLQRRETVDVVQIGESSRKQVVVHTYITDIQNATYTFREPVEPVELGRLYRLFFEENYPQSLSELDQHFVVIDSQDRVIGGIVYKILENNVVQLDGIVVANPLTGRGIGSSMLEHFCERMASQGVTTVKAHFYLQNFYQKHGFKVDRRWGELVKFLPSEKDQQKPVEQDLIFPTD